MGIFLRAFNPYLRKEMVQRKPWKSLTIFNRQVCYRDCARTQYLRSTSFQDRISRTLVGHLTDRFVEVMKSSSDFAHPFKAISQVIT